MSIVTTPPAHQPSPVAAAFEALPFATNSHIHLPPNFSAFDSPSEAIEMATREGMGLVGVSNYYDYRVYADLAVEAARRGIFVLLGTEIIALDEGLKQRGVKTNDPGNPGKMYICGKAMARVANLPPRGRQLLDRIREADARRMEIMAEKLRAVLGSLGFQSDLTAATIRATVAKRAGVVADAVVLQERHLVMAFQREIWSRLENDEQWNTAARTLLGDAAPENAINEVALQDGMRGVFLKAGKPAFVEEEFVTVEEARQLILSADGIPCYPVLADGTNPVAEFERDSLLLAQQLKELGFHTVEFIPNRNSPKVLHDYAMTLRAEGMIVLAGTEHNTTDKIALTPVCAGGVAIPADVRRVFDEGICVAAAHQQLGMRYVDEDGALTVQQDEQEAHIARMAQAGSELLRKYHCQTQIGGRL